MFAGPFEGGRLLRYRDATRPPRRECPLLAFQKEYGEQYATAKNRTREIASRMLIGYQCVVEVVSGTDVRSSCLSSRVPRLCCSAK